MRLKEILKYLEEELARARHQGRQLACARISLDRMAELPSDACATPEIMRLAAQALTDNSQPGDVIAHYSGDSFLVVLSGYPADAAWVYGERIRRVIEADCAAVRVSVGIACFDHQCPTESAEELINRAGEALRQAQAAPETALAVSLNLAEGDSIMCW